MERFFLPVGHFRQRPAADESVHYQIIKERIRVGPAAFTPDRVEAAYTISPSPPIPSRIFSVVALWPGTVQAGTADGMVVVEMLPSTRLALSAVLGEDIPIPVRATYGPMRIQTGEGVSWQSGALGGQMALVKGGETLGLRERDDFTITLQDQNDCFLDTIAYFQLFEREALWNLPSAVRCPLIPDGQPRPLAMVGAGRLAAGMPYLTLSGGSRGVVVHHPPAVLAPEYFTFLSRDTLTVEAQNLGAGASLMVTDVSGVMYRTRRSPPSASRPLTAPAAFVLHDLLRPHHEPYARANGARDPGAALSYRLEARASSGPALVTTISQDRKDVIRQEYVFHGAPFQSGPTVLAVPARADLRRNTARSAHFAPEELSTSNYGRDRGNWQLNAAETFRVAEYLRGRVAQHIDAIRTADPAAVPVTVSQRLVVTSAWRNPERNEAIGDAVDSPHQYGRALDLKSFHRRPVDGFVEANVPLNQALLEAGRDFLQELITLNGAAECQRAEVHLKLDAPDRIRLLWQDSVNASIQGPDYEAALGSPPPVAAQALRRALGAATHVHIAWPSVDASVPLTVPAPAPDRPPSTAPFRNLILLAAEDESVDTDDRIPIDHAAASIKTYLERIDPGTPTQILVAPNPYDFLLFCGAFGPESHRIRRFFVLSHAWEGGLNLTNYDGVPYMRAAGSTGRQIHDERIHDLLNVLYGFQLTIGANDVNEFRTHQLRVSNLRWLPEGFLEQLRRAFANTEGVYVLGCGSAGESDVMRTSFSQELADTLGHDVYGSLVYTKFLGGDPNGQWVEVTAVRGGPPTAFDPIVLVPASGLSNWTKRSFALPKPQPTNDLIEIYQTLLAHTAPGGP